MSNQTTPSPRRTQEERSLETRHNLLEATIDAVNELGYQQASTNKIIERVNVSRGALAHHYPAKIDLLTAAFQHAHKQIIWDIIKLMTEAEKENAAWTDVLDEIWARLFRGRLWNFTLELSVAARSDSQLAERLDPTLHSYRADLDSVWSQYFLHDQATAEKKRQLNLTFCVMRGIALQTVLRDDNEFYDAMMADWKELLKSMN